MKKTNKVIDKFGNPETIKEMLWKCKEYKEYKDPVKVGLLGVILTHANRVSNTHSCPINGVTNWASRNEKPRGYNGWHGRVWLAIRRLGNSNAYITSDYVNLNQTYIHTGTGGGGLYTNPFISKPSHIIARECGYKFYSWDAKIYTDDWPFLQNLCNELLIRKVLDPSAQLTTFKWCIGDFCEPPLS